MDHIADRLKRLEERVDFLGEDLAVLRLLMDQDAASALNKIRFVTEKILHRLCRAHDISWGKGEPTLERMIGPLVAHGVIPRSVSIHVRTIQTNASPGSHFQESALSVAHLTVAQLALLEFIEWYGDREVPAPPSAAPGAGPHPGASSPRSTARRPDVTGEIVVLQGNYTQSVDPAEVVGGFDINLLFQLYEPLIRFDALTGELLPCLATAWTLSERELEIRLRGGVRFHDGSPMTAADVAASLRRSFAGSYGRALFSDVSGVRAVDERTLVLATGESNVSLPWRLTHGVALVTRPGDPHLLGTGPLRLSSWNPSAGAVVMVPFPDHWERSPELSRVVYKTIDDPQRLIATLRRAPNTLAVLPNHPLKGEPARPTTLRTVPVSSFNCANLFLNTRRPFLSVPSNRRAIALAVDCERILAELYSGQAERATRFLPPGLGLGRSSMPLFQRDPARAREILAHAERPQAPLSLFLFDQPLPSTPDPALLARILGENLAEIGIDVMPVFLSFDRWLDAMREDRHDMSYCAISADFPDPAGYYTVYRRSGDEKGWNFGHFEDDEFADLLDKSERERDAMRRRALFDEIEDRLREIVPSVPVAYHEDAVVLGEAIEGVEETVGRWFSSYYSLAGARIRPR